MIPQMHSWYMGTLFIIIGAAISLFTVYFYVGAAFYTGPRDGITLLFTEKSGWPVGLCRSLIDVTVSAAGFLMGGYPGLGTVLNVLVTGPLMQPVFRLFHFDSRAVKQELLLDTRRFLKSQLCPASEK